MKQLFLICLIFCVSIITINCGAEKLDSEKAKTLILKEIDTIVDTFKTQSENNFSKQDLENTTKGILKLKNSISVLGVREEGDSFVAKINVDMGPRQMPAEIKFNKYDTGWQIDEIKGFDNKWVSKSEAVQIAINGTRIALSKARLKATMGDLKNLGTAIESYITDNYKAPRAKTMDELETLLVPFHIKVLPKKDAWGNVFHYLHGADGSKEQEHYYLGSGGSDGKFDGYKQSGSYYYREGMDIIFSNGNFTYSPKVK